MRVIKRNSAAEKFVPSSWEGQEGSPYLLVRKLTRKEKATIEDKRFSLNKSGDFGLAVGTVNYDTVVKSIVGWAGLENEDGTQFVYRSAASAEVLIESEVMTDKDYEDLIAYLNSDSEKEDAVEVKEATTPEEDKAQDPA